MSQSIEDGPIYMLNALWFKPDGGEQAYRKYLRAAQGVSAKYGGKKLEAFVPDFEMIGKFDADLLFFVQWPSWEVFQNFINDEEFLAVRHLREEAIDKSLLIRCRKLG